MEAYSETGQMVLDTAHRICEDAAAGQEEDRAVRAWRALEDAGLTRALDGGGDEEAGGIGLADGLLLAGAPGRHGLPSTLADTLIAGWLAGLAGLACPPGALGLVPVPLTLAGDGVSGVARVPGGRAAAAFVAVADRDDEPHVVVFPAENAAITEQDNVAGDPVDRVEFSGWIATDAMRTLPGAHDRLRLAGAVSRSLLMANALSAVLDLTLSYAPGRTQFGQPLPKFQAIQHGLARMASHCAASQVAALHAARAFGQNRDNAWQAVAAAKARVGEAVGLVTGLAHQIHGATGFTSDYPLHRLTRRAWAWRDEFGSESRWSRELGEHACRAGAGRLWATVTEM
ncbi:MAG: hypothetical protein M0R03_11825 [Novosphingobium sp.]|nr:hypothetical protein [Novosphingobium sp.]